jgi:hypothetical protein
MNTSTISRSGPESACSTRDRGGSRSPARIRRHSSRSCGPRPSTNAASNASHTSASGATKPDRASATQSSEERFRASSGRKYVCTTPASIRGAISAIDAAAARTADRATARRSATVPLTSSAAIASGSSSTRPWQYSSARSTPLGNRPVPWSRGSIAAMRLIPAGPPLAVNHVDPPPVANVLMRAFRIGHTSCVPAGKSAPGGSATSRSTSSSTTSSVSASRAPAASPSPAVCRSASSDRT